MNRTALLLLGIAAPGAIAQTVQERTIEELRTEIEALRAEVALLRAELARLGGGTIEAPEPVREIEALALLAFAAISSRDENALRSISAPSVDAASAIRKFAGSFRTDHDDHPWAPGEREAEFLRRLEIRGEVAIARGFAAGGVHDLVLTFSRAPDGWRLARIEERGW